MHRVDALAHFKENYVDNTVLKYIKELDKYFWQQKDELRQALQENFAGLCQKIAERQATEQKPVGFINLSLLRTSLLEENALYLWDVYGPEWYGDTLDVSEYYPVDWAFDYLKQLNDELRELIRPYGGKVIRQDVALIKQQKVDFFHGYVVALLRYMLRGVEKVPEFQAIKKAPQFHICVGEYLDYCDIVYMAYSGQLNVNKIKRQLQDGDSAYQFMQSVDLSEGDYPFSNLSFSDARGSDFSYSNLQTAQCVGTDFRGCRLVGVALKYSNIADSDFSGCRLQQTDFCWADGSAGVNERKMSTFLGVNFRDSDLTEASFIGADLRRADFRGAIFHKTDFQDTRLKEAIFYTKDKEQLDLTPEQIEEIQWIGEEGI